MDDDAHFRLVFLAWLKRYGFKVAIVDGGAGGLVALDNSTFDLSIADVFMPNMRGFEPVRILHERAPAVPLIAMSGYAFAKLDSSAPDFPRMALELGATRSPASRTRFS